jgi:lipopolysaccharide biosynthesis glycosyltransferase
MINLFFCIDQNNTKQLYLAIYGILQKTQGRLNVRVIHNGIIEDIFIKKTSELLNQAGGIMDLLEILETDDVNLPEGTHQKSKVARLKFKIGNFNCGRALYLDTDIILRDDVAKLYSMDLGGNILGAVPDYNNKNFSEKLGLKQNFHYFNSGVLLIATRLWQSNRITEELIKINNSIGKDLGYVDQDAFNIVFSNFGYKNLGIRWNFPFNPNLIPFRFFRYFFAYRHVTNFREILYFFKNPSLMHFIGSPKPSEVSIDHKRYREFYKMCETALAFERHAKRRRNPQ